MEFYPKTLSLILVLATLPLTRIVAQSYVSRDNYTGSWETPASWNPVWASPQTHVNGLSIGIYGYITANDSILLSGATCILTIYDTLVVKGNLDLGNNVTLDIRDNAVLIIRGSLHIGNQTTIYDNGYLVITGNIQKTSAIIQGSFTSNDNPVKLFIGGSISSGLTDNNPDFPVLNSTTPTTTPYSDSQSAFGNMIDFSFDPLFDFFQATCTVSSVSANSPVCTGDPIQLTSSGGIAYQWTGPNGFTSNMQNPLIANASSQFSGLYKVIITGPSGCTVEKKVNIAVNDLPVKPVIQAAQPTTFCTGGSTMLTASAGESFLWSTGATTQSIRVVASGNYTVVVTNEDGCKSAVSDPVTVTVYALPEVEAGEDTSITLGNNTTLHATVSGTGPFTYVWSPSTRLTDPYVAAPTTTSLLVSTLFTVTATSSSTTCSNTDDIVVSVKGGTLTTEASEDKDSICSGESVRLRVLPAGGSGVYSFTWTSIPAGFSSSEENPIVNPMVSTIYQVEVNDGTNSATAQAGVTVLGKPVTPVIDTGATATACKGDTVILNAPDAESYSWSDGSETKSIRVSKSGNYSVRIGNQYGCLSDSSPVVAVHIIKLPADPSIVASGPITLCEGGNVTLTAQTASAFSWSTGASSPSIIVSESGSYSVQAINGYGCRSNFSQPVNVSVLPLPVVTITSDSSALCTAGSRNLTGSPSGGQFQIDDGPATLENNVLTATGTGIIHIQYSYFNICGNNDTQQITVNDPPQVNAGLDQDLDFIFNTTMQAALQNGETGQWTCISGSGILDDPGSPTSNVTGLSLGENIFSWQVQQGECEASQEVKITVHDVFVPSVITPNGDGKNDYFKINVTTIRYGIVVFDRWGNEEFSRSNYQNDWDGTNNQGKPLPEDTYFYVLTFENGIIKKGSVFIKR